MAIATVTVRIADIEGFRLLCWELRQLENDMRVGASPFAERLERALDRFIETTNVANDDGPEGVA